MIFRFVRVQTIVKWLKDNFSSYQTTSPRDGWRQYLTDHGGTGQTMHDLESSFLAAQGFTQGKLSERWVQYTIASTIPQDVKANWRQRLQDYFLRAVSVSSSYYLLEDGTSKYVLEDGSGFYILE